MTVIEKEKNNANKEWLKRINPLEGLSITQAKNVYNYSRAHGSPLLQKIYDEIELTDPVLMTCVERRQSALSGLGWRAVADASAADPAKAEAQRKAIERFASGIVNLEEAIEHLDLAFFRGFSVVQPIWEADGVKRISILDSWNFLKGDDGNLLWNPNCTLDEKSCTPITPAARCVILMRRRAIDWPALSIFIRKYLGERDWGRFLERYGIPPVDVVMAPNATDQNRAEYEECGEAAKDGRTVAWPSGTNVSRAEGARGTDPFTAFIEHQEKLIVLMATGGTLTSLAQADTGSLAGGAQMDVWTQIVKRDGVLIGAALDRDLFAPFLRSEFPGEPIMAHFELGHEEAPSTSETAELATKLKTAGYLVDQGELEEQVGLKLIKDETQPAFPGGFNALANKILNKEISPKSVEASEPQAKAVLKAFAEDMGPASEAVAKLLKNPTPETAAALLDELPALLPDDPALATVIAEAMAETFGDQIVKNTADAQGNEHDNGNGQFTEKGAGGVGTTESPKAKAKREKHEWQVKAAAQANASMSRVKSGEDCKDFIPGITVSGGKKFDHIAFYQSEYRHIKDHVQGDFGGGKFGYNHQAMLEGSKISHTITHGTWFAHHGDYIAVDGKDKVVVLSPDGEGLKITSAYESTVKANEIRTGGFQRVFNKEDFDGSH